VALPICLFFFAPRPMRHPLLLPLLLWLLLAASALGHNHPLPLPDDQPTARPFCRVGASGHGSAMVPWFLLSWSADPSARCVLLWVKGWTLDTPAKYAAGVAGVFLLAAASEWLAGERRHLDARLLADAGNALPLRVTRSALFGLQMFLAYLLMLVAMLYEVALFGALLLGLAVGHFLFAPLKVCPSDAAAPLLPASATAAAHGKGAQSCSSGSPCCGRYD